jgi:hypothetical protein
MGKETCIGAVKSSSIRRLAYIPEMDLGLEGTKIGPVYLASEQIYMPKSALLLRL